jgi:hypothetical protein
MSWRTNKLDLVRYFWKTILNEILKKMMVYKGMDEIEQWNLIYKVGMVMTKSAR